MFKYSSIHVKLLVLVLAIIVPFAAFTAINIINNYDIRVKSELNTYESLAEAISTALMNYLDEIWAIEDIAGTYIAEHADLSIKEINTYLKLIKEKQEGMVRISWLDPKGNALASSDEKLIQYALSSRTYVRQINSGKEKVVSDLVESVISPYQCIISVVRAIKKEDQLLGMMTAVIDTNELDKRLPDLKIYQAKDYILVDSKGMLVYDSDIKKAPDKLISLINDPSVGKALQGITATSVKEQYVMDNTMRMSVDYPIAKIGWDCKVSSPYHMAMAPFFRELYTNIITLAVATLLSVVVAMILGHNFLMPVHALIIATKKIMEGDYSARTCIKGHDEISLAAEAFDKMAESIERWYSVKTQFFTNISHELKTPLNVIFASVQLIDNYKTSLDSELYKGKVSKQMKLIRQNCYRIMRLIGNLVDISSHDSGFLKIKLSNFDIVKLTREITLSVKCYVEARGIDLNFASELESKTMACDPDMIERILLNLISNAVKFTDRNGMITVRLKDGGDNLILTVEDTGIGIPEDKLSSIFERFRQVEDTYRRNQEGSGIGLSLVKAFVEEHGGTISVTSENLKGTAFHICLPIRVIETALPMQDQSLYKKTSLADSLSSVSRINIEFSDVYSFFDEEIS